MARLVWSVGRRPVPVSIIFWHLYISGYFRKLDYFTFPYVSLLIFILFFFHLPLPFSSLFLSFPAPSFSLFIPFPLPSLFGVYLCNLELFSLFSLFFLYPSPFPLISFLSLFTYLLSFFLYPPSFSSLSITFFLPLPIFFPFYPSLSIAFPFLYSSSFPSISFFFPFFIHLSFLRIIKCFLSLRSLHYTFPFGIYSNHPHPSGNSLSPLPFQLHHHFYVISTTELFFNAKVFLFPLHFPPFCCPSRPFRFYLFLFLPFHSFP